MNLFFRNDDLGWHREKFDRLIQLFDAASAKLNVAAIPLACRETLSRHAYRQYSKSMQVHTHGYAHLDHMSNGKKSEFGANRLKDSVFRELQRAQQLCQEQFDRQYFPAFVPPWNRIEDEYVELLVDTGYKVLSRDGPRRAQHAQLLEFNIDIDLHTSKKIKPPSTPDKLLQQCEKIAQTSPTVGIMLHHKYMDDPAFDFLKSFLEVLAQENIPTLFLSELFQGNLQNG